MWTFEPSTALAVMRDLVKEHDIQVVLNARLDRTPHPTEKNRVSGVVMNENHIVEIRTEDKCSYRGRCFIDATYEGDLLAGAGVSFTVGREATTTYDDPLNGVQTRRAIHHQLKEDRSISDAGYKVDYYRRRSQDQARRAPRTTAFKRSVFACVC